MWKGFCRGALLSAVGVLVGCGARIGPVVEASPSLTPPPWSCGVSTATGPTVLFASDLSDRCPALGGRGFPGADKYGGHEAAGYVVGLGPGVELVEWVRAASYASPPPDDVRVEVEVAITAGTKANLFGVICRFTAGLQRDHPDPTMYSFAIYADGSYKIEYFEGQQANSRDKVLASGSVPLSVTGFNRVRADCDGSRLTLYLNGQRVVSIEDTRLPTGLSGIRAQSMDAIGARLLFRNLIVSRV